jgi:hypothetical protein
MVTDGKSETRTIDDGGEPFRTTFDRNATALRLVWTMGR